MGWSELLLVGIVALIVVGPKDLPVLFQSMGKMTAKVKRMAREFSSAMNEAANSAGVDDISKDLRNMTSSKNLGMDALKDAADKFDKWEPGKSAKKGPATQALSEERAAAAKKIHEKSAKDALARQAKEAEAAKAAAEAPAPAAETPKTEGTA